MHRFDRALAILLLLRDGKSWSATALAARLEVSTRTTIATSRRSARSACRDTAMVTRPTEPHY